MTKHTQQGTDPSSDTPTISEVVGEGAEAHRLVRVGAWTLTAWVAEAEGQEPRGRDVDMAERLGYDRPRKVRELVERNRTELEVFGPILVRPTVGRGRNQHGETSALVETTEYWLNEGQALLVAILSRTARAAAIRAELIRVFMLARRGLLPDQSAALREEVALLREQNDILRGLVVAQQKELAELRIQVHRLAEGVHEARSGSISGIHADDLRASIRYLAAMWARLGWCPGAKQTEAAARRAIQNEISRLADWGARGQRLELLPAASHPYVRAFVNGQIDRAEKAIRRTPRKPMTDAKNEQTAFWGSGRFNTEPN